MYVQGLQRGLCVQAEYIGDDIRQSTVGPLTHDHALLLVLHKRFKY